MRQHAFETARDDRVTELASTFLDVAATANAPLSVIADALDIAAHQFQISVELEIARAVGGRKLRRAALRRLI